MVEGDWRSFGVASEIISTVCESNKCNLSKSPVRLCYPDSHTPASSFLENEFYINENDIVKAIEKIVWIVKLYSISVNDLTYRSFMGKEVDLLKNYPRSNRNIIMRSEAKTNYNRQIARQFGKEYFDGDRAFGYGGYTYDPRFWEPVIPIFKDYYSLT